MIRRIKYKDIDFEKYTECLKNSSNYRIYAEVWYLNAVTNNQWDCFVEGEYEVVMPLPYIKIMGAKLISQPILTQQLGIFSYQINENIVKKFFKALSKLWVLSYNFNEQNIFSSSCTISKRVNQTLLIDDEYNNNFKKFKKDRLKDLKRIEKLENDITLREHFDKSSFLEEIIQKYPHLSHIYKSEKISNLIDELIHRGKIQYIALQDTNKQVISSLFLVKSKDRHILLLSSKDTSGKYKGAFAFLISSFIKKESSKRQILDFEGSSIPSICLFNESFGAITSHFSSYGNLNFLIKIKKALNFFKA